MQLKEIELEKLKITEAEVEACNAMSIKDENNKEIEREKHKNSVKMLTINHDQALIRTKKKQA